MSGKIAVKTPEISSGSITEILRRIPQEIPGIFQNDSLEILMRKFREASKDEIPLGGSLLVSWQISREIVRRNS